MTKTSTTSPILQSEAETTVHLLDNWFDAIEVGLRERVREFIQATGICGHRHGHRSRSLMGTFGRVEIAVPRAGSRARRARQPNGRVRRCELTSGEPSKPIR